MRKVKTQTKEQHHLNMNFKNSVSLMSTRNASQFDRRLFRLKVVLEEISITDITQQGSF